MNKQTDTDVVINGKKYTLSGYESNDYMQKVASYLNDKCAQMAQQTDFRYLDKETQNVLVQLNIADDYFKLKSQMKSTAATPARIAGRIHDSGPNTVQRLYLRRSTFLGRGASSIIFSGSPLNIPVSIFSAASSAISACPS